MNTSDQPTVSVPLDLSLPASLESTPTPSAVTTPTNASAPPPPSIATTTEDTQSELIKVIINHYYNVFSFEIKTILANKFVIYNLCFVFVNNLM